MSDALSEVHELAVQMLNHRRHEWSNHLQVIFGYLSLAKYEEMGDYLRGLFEKQQSESRIAKLGDADFVFYLFSYGVRYPHLCFEIEIPVPFNIWEAGLTIPMRDAVKNWLDLFGRFCLAGEDDLPSLILTLNWLDHEVHICTDFVGNLKWSEANREWNRVKTELQRCGGTVSEKVVQPGEWVVEVRFPHDPEVDRMTG